MKLHPELFDRIESLEGRVEDLEEELSETRAHQKRIVSQVGQNTRDIDRLKQRRPAA
jgi:TolA-binding protein